ncbi:hypothetical protein BKA69DRAFT_779997 [Paraphysoderma sedebokerense]|nr:hypothetical protein BKA69DRAFT_779997 [Paraphysoderma sedebokerense]
MTLPLPTLNLTTRDGNWQRYADIIHPVSRWQDITRFSIRCSDRFFECTFTLSDSPEHTAVGVCGNYMSICTFQNDVWPDSSQVPTDFDSYSTRLCIYRALLENMLYRAPTYFTFPLESWSLYSFSTHTFTNAGATGRLGPTLSACRGAYSSQPWAQNSTLFGMTIQGIQEWMVPRYRGTVERVARCPKLIGLTLRTRPHRRRRRWWMARGRWRWVHLSRGHNSGLEGKDELATLSGDIILIVNDTFGHKGREGLEAAEGVEGMQPAEAAAVVVVVETTTTAIAMAAGKEEGPSMRALTNATYPTTATLMAR